MTFTCSLSVVITAAWPRTDAVSFPKVRFATAPSIVAGDEYAIVFTNTSDHPAENYVSVNSLVAPAAGDAPQRGCSACLYGLCGICVP